jgi:hypothetical protein
MNKCSIRKDPRSLRRRFLMHLVVRVPISHLEPGSDRSGETVCILLLGYRACDVDVNQI